MNFSRDKHMVKAIVDLAVFLEFTDSSLLDEDASIKAMEQLASELCLLDDHDRIELSRQIRDLAATYGDSAHGKFVAELPKNLGLV